MNRMTIEEAIHTIETAMNIGEVFYKGEDIVTLLNNLKVEETQSTDPLNDHHFIAKLKAKIVEKLDDEIDNTSNIDFVELYTAKFMLSGNEIQLDDIDINSNQIRGCFRDAFDNAIEDLREEETDNE